MSDLTPAEERREHARDRMGQVPDPERIEAEG